MKKDKLAVMIFLLMLVAQVRADDAQNGDAPLSDQQVAEVQSALDALARAKILVLDDKTHELKLRADILEKLRAQGRLKSDFSAYGNFCY